jgi:hypothetical protein
MRPKFVIAIFVLFFTALPLSAQKWEVYDNFKGPLLDPNLWRGSQSDGNALEFVRQIQNGSLLLGLRSFGYTFTDDGGQSIQNYLAMPQPAGTIGLGARLMVTRAMANYCPLRVAENTPGSFALSAVFFNSGIGDQLDDIVADLWINLPPNGQPLTFDGYVHSRRENFGQVHLGEIKIGEPIYVWIRWDQAAKQIIFGLHRLWTKQPPLEQAVPYMFSDTTPPAGPVRVVLIQTLPQNCAHVQVYSDMIVKVNQVTVLR